MVDQTSAAGHVPRRLRLGRGLFRLWVILSLLWIAGISTTVYRPAARNLLFNYETGTLDTVPVILPRGQEGIHWRDLSEAQQYAVEYSVSYEALVSLRDKKQESYAKMLWDWDKDNDHEESRFKLVPLTSIKLPKHQYVGCWLRMLDEMW